VPNEEHEEHEEHELASKQHSLITRLFKLIFTHNYSSPYSEGLPDLYWINKSSQHMIADQV